MGQRPPANVTAVAAIAKDVPVYLDEIGRTVAVESVSIVPQVGGKILAAHVTDGASVKKGDLLFEIDPRPFEAALASANAMLEQNRADVSLAESDYNRVAGLVKTAAVSQQEFDQKKSGLAVARAKILSGQAEVDTAKLNLEYTKIYSPMNGRAGARLVDAGNVVKANEGSLLSIQRLDPIYDEFTVTENELSTVRKFMAESRRPWGESPERGLTAFVDIPGVDARVQAAIGTPSTEPSTQPTPEHGGAREGTITFLDNTVQPGTGTVKLRATVANADHYFWPGQFVTTRLVLKIKKDAVLIPATAQQVGQQGAFVYIAKDAPGPDGKPGTVAELRPIVPGQSQGEMIVVESGVAVGEKVITTGQMMIMPNAPVMVVDPNAGHGAPGGNASADAR